MSRLNKQQFGFTLIEMLLVLSILASSTGIISYGVYHASRIAKLKLTSKQLLVDIKHARTSAIRKRENIDIHFEPGEYRISELNITRLIDEPIAVSFDAEGQKLTFNSAGFTSGGTLTISSGTRSQSINIAKGSGIISYGGSL